MDRFFLRRSFAPYSNQFYMHTEKVKPRLNHFLIALIILLFSSTAKAQNMSTQTVSAYESQVKQFKPASGLAATNSNDVRRFIYEWFTQFEHATPASYYVGHLDDKNMSLAFPGQAPLISHADFTKWYNNLLAQTLWNFHEVSNLQIKHTAPHEFLVSFIVNWYGEVKASSEQVAGWQSRKDSYLYHYTLRQTWVVKDSNKLIIEKLIVTGGDRPSPITE